MANTKASELLNKAQLACLDGQEKKEFLKRFWSRGPDDLFPGTWVKDWNLTNLSPIGLKETVEAFSDKNGD